MGQLESMVFNSANCGNFFTRQRGKKRKSDLNRRVKIPSSLCGGIYSSKNKLLPSPKLGFGIHSHILSDVPESHGKMGVIVGQR